MAHIHFTGRLEARAEEDMHASRKAFYVRLTDAEAARAYLPARNAAHAQRIAAAINEAASDAAEGAAAPCASRRAIA
jgi:hypothetical protein